MDATTAAQYAHYPTAGTVSGATGTFFDHLADGDTHAKSPSDGPDG